MSQDKNKLKKENDGTERKPLLQKLYENLVSATSLPVALLGVASIGATGLNFHMHNLYRIANTEHENACLKHDRSNTPVLGLMLKKNIPENLNGIVPDNTLCKEEIETAFNKALQVIENSSSIQNGGIALYKNTDDKLTALEALNNYAYVAGILNEAGLNISSPAIIDLNGETHITGNLYRILNEKTKSGMPAAEAFSQFHQEFQEALEATINPETKEQASINTVEGQLTVQYLMNQKTSEYT